MDPLGPPRGNDLIDWMRRAAKLGTIPCVVPVTVDGTAGVGHAAFTDHGGFHDQCARSDNPAVRAYVGVDLCRRTYAEAAALGAEAG